jgi:glycosyltransferase involved in cell wall biosynthesis
MRILLVNHPDCQQFKGGDSVVLRKTGELLRSRGIVVGESISQFPDATDYDCAHIFNSNPPALLQQCYALKQQRIPVVMTPIFHQFGFLNWAKIAIQGIFSEPRTYDEMTKLLEGLRTRQLQVFLPGGGTLSYSAETNDPEIIQREKALLEAVDYLMPASYMEMSQICKTLRVTQKPFQIVRFGSNTEYLASDPEEFITKYGVRDFVLMVGRFDGAKNHLMLLHAMKNVDIPLVLVGNMMFPEYVELCKQIAGPRTLFIPYLEMSELKSAYAAARVHVLPSFMETCGMVTMEAALADCNVVASCTGNEIEYFRDYAYYCDPVDPESIQNSVLRAYENYPRDRERREKLKQLILQEYSWDEAVNRTIKVYEEVCSTKI